MTDPRARYLKIQAELGGPEVVLSDGRTVGQADVAEENVPVAEPVRPSDTPTVRRNWRTDAPPIPGAGLTIASGTAADLLTGEPPFGSLEEVARVVSTCEKCALCKTRRNTVPGEGNPRARLLCVGEGPGETEDQTGRPFVGRAGELLTAMLAAIELPRETVFIANVVKCRPPQNRKPLPDEMSACLPYLRRQIQLIQPTVILALGATAAEGLLGVKKSLSELRTRVHRWDGIPLIITYHPAALLRNPNWKKPAWDDVRIARQLLGD
jgi:DNA polymerase